MKEEEIKRLVKIVEESNIAELEITRWGRTIKISKFSSNSHHNVANLEPTSYAAVPAAVSSPTVSEKETDSAKETETSRSKAEEIKSPMVGTFYSAPAPDADPYVGVNSVVRKGQVLCIIEAMKLMNEIESEFDGKIVEILVENAQPVEYNQPLFRIEKV